MVTVDVSKCRGWVLFCRGWEWGFKMFYPTGLVVRLKGAAGKGPLIKFLLLIYLCSSSTKLSIILEYADLGNLELSQNLPITVQEYFLFTRIESLQENYLSAEQSELISLTKGFFCSFLSLIFVY